MRHVTIRAAIDAAEIKTAKFEDREHLVVPVIALVGNVIVRPLGSRGPEFVPADELSRAPGGWNGRPVVPDHPDKGAASANEPRMLERFAFGRMFHTRFEEGKLKTEAWLDPARAAAVGRDAERVIERVKAGEPVEVSVGAWVTAEETSGEWKGEKYEAVWHDIVPDHLAMLPDGATGACSVEMGCGAPRLNRQNDNDRRQQVFYPKVFSFLARKVEEWRESQDDEGTSDAELRQQLDALIRSSIPAYQGIVEVFPESKTVIYATAPEDTFLFFRDTYSGEGKTLELNGSPEEVEPTTRYEPVAAARADNGDQREPRAARDGGCSCGGSIDADQGATHMSQKVKDLVGALISNELTPFTEADAEILEQFPEERLQAMSEGYEPEEESAATETTEDSVEEVSEPETAIDEDQVMLSREEYKDVMAAAQCWKQMQAQERSALIDDLHKTQDTYSLEELRAMSLEQLTKTKSLVGSREEETVDYGARFLVDPQARNTSYAPPDPWGIGDGKKKEAN